MRVQRPARVLLAHHHDQTLVEPDRPRQALESGDGHRGNRPSGKVWDPVVHAVPYPDTRCPMS